MRVHSMRLAGLPTRLIDAAGDRAAGRWRAAVRARADLSAWLRHDSATAYAGPPEAARDRLRPLVDAAAPILGPDRLRRHLDV